MKVDNDIQKLHKCLRLILDEIDRICQKNNIPYFLDSGSALGAIRHKGFIPWDDDADVGMLRENYDKFILAAQKDLKPEFYLQTMKIDPNYPNFNAKIRLNGTFFPEKYNAGLTIHQGIFVDIFPFDYINDIPEKAIKETIMSRKIIAALSFRRRPFQKERPLKMIGRFIFRVVPKSFLVSLCNRYYISCESKPTKTVTCFSYRMNADKILHFQYSDMATTHYVDFEDSKYQIMDGYDNYLKTMYGDYMELPPEEKRVVHIDGTIEFNEYE